MNYALDALWWRLSHPQVRDLAALLTAPALWLDEDECPVADLLGENGFRCLLALNDRPQILSAYLAKHAPFGGRLGIYAEYLLAFWLDYAPHCRLLARNFAVKHADGRQLGALDFVAQINGSCLHIELSCKYYGAPSGLAADLAGLNPNDRLTDKAAKLRMQLSLSRREEGRRALNAAGWKIAKAVSVVRGIGFGADGRIDGRPLNPLAWQGCYRAAASAQALSDGHYYRIPRLAYLAPARLEDGTGLMTAEEAARCGSCLLADMVCRPDGCWHEDARIMQFAALGS